MEIQNQTNVNLDLTVDEVNTVLEALGELPFVKVFNIINKIQSQAHQQLNGQPTDGQ